jgi:hypothetical protein
MKPTLIEETNLQIQMQAGMTMYISALIVEHCNLDAVAEDDTGERFDLDYMNPATRLPGDVGPPSHTVKAGVELREHRHQARAQQDWRCKCATSDQADNSYPSPNISMTCSSTSRGCLYHRRPRRLVSVRQACRRDTKIRLLVPCVSGSRLDG